MTAGSPEATARSAEGGRSADSPPGDGALSGVARGGAINIIAAACNQLCLFAIISVLARVLGGRAVGEYSLSWAILVIVGMCALSGFQAALTRFVAMFLAQGNTARVRGAIRLGMRASICLSLVMATGIALLAGPLSRGFHQPGLATLLRLVALTVPAATIRDAALAATQGWRSQRAYALIASIFEPLLRLSLTLATVVAGLGVTAAFAAIPVAAWCAAALALVSLRRRVSKLPDAVPIVDARTMWRFSAVSWATEISSAGLIWVDSLILGALGTAQQLGVYNISTRIVNLAVFVMVPVVVALEPQLVNLLHRGDRRSLKDAYLTTTRWMLTLSIPAFIVLIFYARNLLSLFGAEYVAGATVTIVLSCGQLVNGATGACGALLNMSGHVRLNMINNIVTLALNVFLNIVLIPRFGITGAGVAWSVSLAAVNIARVVENRILFGVLPFGRQLTKVFMAGAVAALIAIGIRTLLANQFLELVLGAVAVLVGFVAVLWLLGAEPDDRAALRSITGRH